MAMASNSSGRKQKPSKRFNLFDCDKICGFDQVKSLLEAVETNVNFKVVLTFESVDEILKCDYSNESY